jgi:octaprenyl-diphosphate synthase
MLTLLAARLNGSVNQKTIDAAIALEMLHTASLIHDDVIDDTDMRRGKPAVQAKWSNKIAILSGDYILSKSLGTAVNTADLNILRAVAGIGSQLSDGEILQLKQIGISETSEAEYFTIIRKKTALLFATCVEAGGLSTDMDAESLNHLKLFGEYLGICFQIKDDLFDYFENADLGKPTGNDIRDGKITLPLIHALLHSTDPFKKQILSWMEQKDFSKEHVHAMTRFAHENNGIEYAIQTMEHYKSEAVGHLMHFKPGEVRNSLLSCIEFAADRSM